MVTIPLMDCIDNISLVLVIEEHFSKNTMSRNSDPEFTGLSFCAAIDAHKSPLNATNILLFLTSASCVLLDNKMSFLDF